MAKSGSRETTETIQSTEGDDVEKSIELLDKVLSEFEDPDSLPPVLAEPDSPSQGHQSEDDGYMSMNGRRAKFSPGFQPTDEIFITPPISVLHQQQQKHIVEHSMVNNDTKLSPPSPEIAEKLISDLLPRLSPLNIVNTSIINITQNNCIDKTLINGQSINSSADNENVSSSSSIPSQTTLPKARPPSTVIPSRYASLPCSSPPRLSTNASKSKDFRFHKEHSLDSDGRTILGIGISAVHDAVLRGVARIPEPIINEHPVTIYPGRSSPSKKMAPPPPRTVPTAMDRHREVCRIININDSHSQNNHIQDLVVQNKEPSPPVSSSSISSIFYNNNNNNNVCPSISLTQMQDIKSIKKSEPLSQMFHIVDIPPYLDKNKYINNHFEPSIKYNPNNNNNNNQQPQQQSKQHHNHNNNNNNNNHNHHQQHRVKHQNCSEDSEDFSDDSLEGTSLPPPPPPPIVPPPPSLSAPVTPNKRSSIAWEINLDNPLDDLTADMDDVDNHQHHYNTKQHYPLASQHHNNNSSNQLYQRQHQQQQQSHFKNDKIIGKRRHHGRNLLYGSQSSLASSTAGNNSTTSITKYNLTGSSEWPEPPSTVADPPICSTEDEATSLHSDSDDIIPYTGSMKGHGTYVIRKGRRERQRLTDLESLSSSINSRLSNEENLCLTNSLYSSSGIAGALPNSRHSIDLGPLMSSTSSISPPPPPLPVQNLLNSPRTRLSLDLSSPPTSELPATIKLATSNTILSPTTTSTTYTEFKTYSSTFDGLHALVENNNLLNHNTINSNNDLRDSNNNNNNNNHDNDVNNNNNSNNNHINDDDDNNNNINHNNININCINGNENLTCGSTNNINNLSMPLPLVRVSSLPSIPPPLSTTVDIISTPRRELAPPIEEDEEQDSESQRGAPLRQIENNISALLRGDIIVARVGDIAPPRRPLGFRPGVHKSESAKEMLLSQNIFGPLPPSPLSTSPEEQDGFPPLPPSPHQDLSIEEDITDIVHDMQNVRINSNSNSRIKSTPESHRYHRADTIGSEHKSPPIVPPHKGNSLNALKTRSMDAGFSKSYRNNTNTNSSTYSSTSPHGCNAAPLPQDLPGSNTRRRLMSGAFPKRTTQSPREERRLQTSCSLPETPIFARGCDIPRTPHRRAPELPGPGGSRTAPRQQNPGSLNSSIVGIGSTIGNSRQRSISQAVVSGEMLRLAGGPARGWYPKQRHPRPVSTENLDRLNNPQGSMRAWDSGTGGRKPLTLPPNLTPKFFNKSPREALRRVTSLLIRKGHSGKDKEQQAQNHNILSHPNHQQPYINQSSTHNKRVKELFSTASSMQQQQQRRSPAGSVGIIEIQNCANLTVGNNAVNPSTTSTSTSTHKKKGFFKNFWKKSKHYSLEKQ